MKHNPKALWAAMLSAGLLVACGGSGGDGDNNGGAPATPTAVSVSGVAAKGLMANADVSVHAVNADGTIAAAALKTVSTGADGKYTLSFNGTAGAPYVVIVAAKADGSTTHADEATGTAQALPGGFQLRALVTVPSTGTTAAPTINVTPFSDLAVAAAAKASGGLTAANIAQATSTVKQLLNFDPVAVVPKTVATATSTDEQALAVLLTAVSEMAKSGAAGCTDGTAGAKTQCVVQKLSSAASATSLQLDAGGTNVSAALNTALQTVVATLPADISPTVVTGVTKNLTCAADACKPATAVTGTTATAITSAKNLFTDIRSDITALFKKGGATASSPAGTFNNEAFKFQQALKDVQVPAELLIRDSGALLKCIDHFNDYRAGRTTLANIGAATDTVAGDASGFQSGVGCGVYQDADASIESTSAANANYIGMGANYYVQNVQATAGTTVHLWRHSFTVTPGTSGAYSYSSRAVERITSPNGQRTNKSLQLDASNQPRRFTGNLTTTVDSAGHITAFTLKGKLPGAFKQDGNTLVNDNSDIDLSGTRDLSAGVKSGTSSVAGSLVAYAADGSTQGTLTVKSATMTELPVSRDANGALVSPTSPRAVASAGGDTATGSLNLVWTTAAAEFEGSLSATDSVWDASGTSHTPTKVVLEGALRNISGGTKTEFLKGKLTFAATGYDKYNETLADSTGNHFVIDATFLGTATATGRPALELTFTGSQKSYEEQPTTASLQYRSLVNGQAKTVVSLSMGTADANGQRTWTLSEAAANLSLSWVGSTWLDGGRNDSAPLKRGSDTIGTFTAKDGLLTFTDGTFVSVDLGL